VKYLDNQVVGDSSGNAYAADGNGNPTTYKGQTLTFDPENRMTAYGVPQSGHATLTAGYTGDGMRAWKESASGIPIYFLYDGDTLVAELGGTGAVDTFYTWGGNGLVSRDIQGTSSFFTYDPAGSVATVSNSAGTMTEDECYDAVGTREDSYNTRPVDFCGQWGYYYDSETGLMLCGHRYYDVFPARFLNRDPIRYRGGPNLYQYVGNNETDATDPTGYLSNGPVASPPAEPAPTPVEPAPTPVEPIPPGDPAPVGPIGIFGPIVIGVCLLLCFPTPTANPCQDQIDSCGPAPSPTPQCETYMECFEECYWHLTESDLEGFDLCMELCQGQFPPAPSEPPSEPGQSPNE
jgi:RHS repeat-associated protein